MSVPVVLLAGQSNAGRIGDTVAAALNAIYGPGGHVLVDVHAAGAPLTRDRPDLPDWFNRGELPDQLTAAAIAALRQTAGSHVAGLIWVQGEGDTFGTARPDDYAPAFQAMWGDVLDGIDAALPDRTPTDGAIAVISGLSADAPQAATRGGWSTVIAAQDDLATAPDIVTVRPDDLAAAVGLSPAAMFADPLHYSESFGDLLAWQLVLRLAGLDQVPRLGTAGHDGLSASAGAEWFLPGDGQDTIRGGAPDLGHDIVAGFGAGDRIVLVDAEPTAMTVSAGGATIRLPDGPLTLQGDLGGGGVFCRFDGTDSLLGYLPDLPALADGVALPPDRVAGITDTDMLTGDGSARFRVDLLDLGHAALRNALGVYEVTDDGRITDLRMLFADAGNTRAGPVTVTGVEDGHRLGFFILQDGAEWMASQASADAFHFVTGDDGRMRLAAGREVAEMPVFHALDAALNPDGLQHVVSGHDGGGLAIGFEDLTGGGDRDFEDVVIRVTPSDAIFA